MRFLILVMCFIPLSLRAEDLSVRDGWAVHKTDKPYVQLVKDTRAAVKTHGMFVVTQAGPTAAAAKRGITIPGNRVIGVFNNDFAVKVLGTSTAAMIEAPIRLYVTENANKTATLSYKMPTFIFAPYKKDGGTELMTLAEELDSIFAKIAKDAQN
ncbi:hypothetical protein ASD8599_00584 [Ascidiaceihabitans donghaensis]|uniref:DUF302 domain-containing protein n=1 Tax=Ascidiaceihabitans donghaensis TaxID=1510460 RepID=A0A2R8B9U0_9RHOB|nr:DUF302 domain-containing protein [Ascidiaceihabitans donghaensis]SPH19844.1 hypothetical protein ASD8599_00584 [Ascidiaceihabitans donghaensis]